VSAASATPTTSTCAPSTRSIGCGTASAASSCASRMAPSWLADGRSTLLDFRPQPCHISGGSVFSPQLAEYSKILSL
jgi:hypothetical protein